MSIVTWWRSGRAGRVKRKVAKMRAEASGLEAWANSAQQLSCFSKSIEIAGARQRVAYLRAKAAALAEEL
jgi:hypothetical protein